jgi:N-methylhydantoinase A/oxoprolinase/acetone carboxylase beta subunit
MRIKIVACGVFEPYIRHLASQTPHTLSSVMLDAGLHARPHELRLQAQAAIDEADRAGGFDAVIVLYGLCGRGTAGLIARRIPVIIPRAHDCMTLFMGSRFAYMRQFSRHPGTFYHTLGWLQKKVNPNNREAGELYRNYQVVGYDKHPDFKALQRQFGDENARHIIAFHERWKQHYTRAAYIDMGLPEEAGAKDFTRDMARIFGWLFEEIPGTLDLLRRLLNGERSEDDCVVIPPGHRSQSTGDEHILAAVPVDSADAATVTPLSDRTVTVQAIPGNAEPAGVGLGIDAGGTYTDAVIYDFASRTLLAKAKALTTYHDYVEGIRNALALLPADKLAQVQVTALSTTLATNATVEGRGHRVGALVLSPWEWTSDDFDHTPLVHLRGAVSITGEVLQPLDEDHVRSSLRHLVEKEHCAALVIAGYATVRNPEQANRVRELALELYDLPVICVHEVSRRLDMYQGARAAVANAKLLPIIRDLLDSVHRALADHHVHGKLMVVKGDGTSVDDAIARERPVETILSGPAASARGARLLADHPDALVIDVGGTTTDCAVLEGGHATIAEDGVRVGDEFMSIDAVDIITVGLGGDSRLDFTPDRHITVGPARQIPLCFLASEHASIRDFLRTFDRAGNANSLNARTLDVLTLRSRRSTLELTDREAKLVALLERQPQPAVLAAQALDLPSPILLPLSRLEGCGMVQRSSLTPTDLLHVNGQFVRWDVEAARWALEIFAAMYGRPVDQVLRMGLEAVTRRLFEEIVRREASFENPRFHVVPEDWQFLLDRAFAGGHDDAGLQVRLTIRRPVIAVGAPAGLLVPPVAEHLDVRIVVPEHADVANAIGAIGSEVVIREEILIQPDMTVGYVLHGRGERMEFSSLERATEVAVERTRERARQRAIDAGARAPEIVVVRKDGLGTVSDGSQILVGRSVTAIASGGLFG